MINEVLSMLVEKLDPWIPMRGHVIAVCKDSRVGDVEREEIPEPHLIVAVGRPRLVSMAIEAVHCDYAFEGGETPDEYRRIKECCNRDSLYLGIYAFG